ncbi:Hachiman antiphage defense system protein HamA [Elizabethkingia anophelis]|uniref:Hachiman antiphage defense system protein HamA n=1 Tax=Elizabethkingia anophelis TaxID=1117645 RepID=UPI000B35B406|nr:Hachiman antiphage defense system protein HamA [Elizabethkingia anophelis]
MSLHEDLIGAHPSAPNEFERWMNSSDIEPTNTRCHRALTSKLVANESALIQWLAEKLVYHHYDQTKIDRLKQRYRDVGFPQYAEQNRNLPRADKTKKGNATEILLIEYIESCQRKPLVKAFKLRYNPNVDQAIKGDDTLMVDIIVDDKGKDCLKIFLGESKFRGTPTKMVINEITKSLGKDKLPLSFSFLISELSRDPATMATADLLDSFLISEIKSKGDIIYTGFLLSNTSTSTVVETHLTTDNPELIFISAGIDEPQTLIDEAFIRAEAMIANPMTL